MINSMTGFARSEAQLADGQLHWEIRSVNHRYLDLNLRIPEGFRALESDLRQLVSSRLSRGKVDATLTLNYSLEQASATSVNLPQARQVIAQLETVAKDMKNPAPVSPATILRWPGVLKEEQADPQPAFPAAMDALTSAVDSLCENRAREGLKLKNMLERRCKDIESILAAVLKRLPTVLKEIHEKLNERIISLNVQPDEERLEHELAIVVQKLDVSEELDRLQAHVEEVRNIVEEETPVGRRLDFLMQELNREANTLGSKSADSETTQYAVELKVLIEQMREQVQNVE